MKCEFSEMTDAISGAALAGGVSGALKKAAQSTGVGFDYLYRVALRESSLDPMAQAKTSSAAGLFQFIEETWLSAVKKFGAAHGLSADAADIEIAGGKPRVADAARKRQILDLRFDPEKAAALAAELARENRAALEKALGRAVDAAELYAAHFLGAGGAKKLLSANAKDSAAALLPGAAKANRAVFYDGAREKTVAEVIDNFRATIGGMAQAMSERVEKALAPHLRETAAFTGALLSRAAGEARPQAAERGFSTAPAHAEGARPLSQAEFGPGPASINSLSPLILAVLQALDPRDRMRRDRE